ncbi:MAG: dTDP-4-dehydrorhamnose 3,5-epimerase family protein [Microbacteriaceae bacterium]|nr:dTDP-4-dehydrorhamnose 3,5-epimerase family protein [Microbacteriaceae bacterium]
MQVRELAVLGAYEFTPVIHGDARGAFLESYRVEPLVEAIGREVAWRQTNVSVSARGVVRGIHYSIKQPGQAKYVTVAAGSAIDYVVDLRPGSPTYLRVDRVRLDAETRRSVFIPAGVGHAFASLEDGTTLHYLCTEVYDPETEKAVSIDDVQIALDLPFPRAEAELSARDAAAPTLAEAVAAGHLRPYQERTPV